MSTWYNPSWHGPDCPPVVVIVVDLFLSTGMRHFLSVHNSFEVPSIGVQVEKGGKNGGSTPAS